MKGQSHTQSTDQGVSVILF